MKEDNRTYPKITVATVTFNAEATIERTLHSVECQTYNRLEHLIIDGCSEDGTIELVQRYIERNTKPKEHAIRVVHEPDKGLYDAMNKALRLADGHYLVFLNAGDTFHEDSTLEQLVECIDWEERGVNPAVVYGETDLVDNEGRFLRHRRLKTPEKLVVDSFKNGMLVCHQSFYVRTDIAKHIHFDLGYRYSSDYDWCIRVLKVARRRRLNSLNTHLILTHYLSEGLTTKNHRKSLVERLRVMAQHYGWPTAIGRHLWFIVRAVFYR